MKKLLAIAVTCALLGGSMAALAAGDASAGKQKSATCTACHNADGNSVNPQWPKLASQHASYTVKQLSDFKANNRVNPIMNGMAAPLSQQDMEDLATYYNSQAITRGQADPALVKKGEEIFRGGNLASGVPACTGCHSPTGAGNPQAAFPYLASQHVEYIETQLRAFRAMERANDAGEMMRNIAMKMTDAEIKAVASYMQGLQ